MSRTVIESYHLNRDIVKEEYLQGRLRTGQLIAVRDGSITIRAINIDTDSVWGVTDTGEEVHFAFRD